MKVLLTAINAKFVHSSLAMRYLYAVSKDLPIEVEMLEVSINNHLLDIANRIFDARPDIVSISCYIWNIELVKQLLPLIKRMLPECKIVCGGPEVSYEVREFMEEFPMVSYVIRGEGEEVFVKLLEQLIADSSIVLKIPGLASREIINGESKINESIAVTVKDLDTIPFPYTSEDIKDLKDRIIYYESSRGCPYSCKYCLSCATKGVRYRSLDRVFAELDEFIRQDVRQVKFVDRTFNADKRHYLPILEYIAKQNCRTNFHFEIVAYQVDEEVKAVLAKMPKGRVQFEIGIQSTNKKTLGQISRVNHWEAMTKNIKALLQFGTIHLHVDLIIGLPYEDLESFQISFNEVYELKADMLQVGFLKLLKGAAMNDLVDEHEYVYMPQAPYQVISNKYMDYSVVRYLEVFVDVLELYYNSGRFNNTLDAMLLDYPGDPYSLYKDFTDYWFGESLHLAPHSPQKLVEFMIDFIEQNNRLSNKKYILNMLKLDSLLIDKGRYRHERLPWQELNKAQKDAFYMSEAKSKYISDYEFKSWRDLMNKYHIELFDYDVKKKECIVEALTPILFNFKDKVGEYTLINIGDLEIL